MVCALAVGKAVRSTGLPAWALTLTLDTRAASSYFGRPMSEANVQDPPFDPTAQIAAELNLPARGVSAVVRLVAEGATVPFMARYRKEQTGGLDEVQIRTIQERHAYLVELDARRKTVLSEIDKQGKLTDSLKSKILGCTTKAELEDLYLPYKPKRRTRAIIARERGLEPLAELMWSQDGSQSPEAAAAAFVDAAKEVADVNAALAGARDICAERIAEDAEVRGRTRQAYLERGELVVIKTKEHAEAKTKFDNYADFREPVANMPSHRYLAIRRGETEGVLRASLEVDDGDVRAFIAKHVSLDSASPWAAQLSQAIEDAMARLLLPGAQVDVRVELKMKADKGAIDVFAANLRELLLAAPLGSKRVLGIDPASARAANASSWKRRARCSNTRRSSSSAVTAPSSRLGRSSGTCAAATCPSRSPSATAPMVGRRRPSSARSSAPRG